MSTLSESLNAGSALNAALTAATETLSSQQTVTFVQYIKYVSPLDGMTYWVESGTVSTLLAAFPNVIQPNQTEPNAAPGYVAVTLMAKGSLHFMTEFKQEEDAQYGKNRVVFTSEEQISDFNVVGPTTMYIATLNGFMYAFSAKKNFYAQAGLFHYFGDAVYPMMTSQIVSSLALVNNLVISNSLPIWLSNSTVLGATIYPSFQSLPNASPPYVTVHIGETDTRSLQPVPAILNTFATDASGNLLYPLVPSGSGHWQLCQDKVRLTLWGFSNNAALTFVDALTALFGDGEAPFGLVGGITMGDAKKTQHELQILGQKKVVTLNVTYYQKNAYVQALKLITQGLFNVYMGA